MMKFDNPIFELNGIARRYKEKLEKLELKTIGQLLFHFPIRHEDFSGFKKISELEAGQSASVTGKIISVSSKYGWKRKLSILEIIIADETGKISCVWFNQPYLTNIFRTEETISVAGKVSLGKKGLYFSSPSYEKISQEEIAERGRETRGLIPIYSETKGLTSRGLRFLIKNALEKAEFPIDSLPEKIRKKFSFPEIKKAFQDIHFPEKIKDVERARLRFAFENVFLIQLAILRQKQKNQTEKAPVIPLLPRIKLEKFASKLKFKLTESQRQSVWEIFNDMNKNHPMNRLLEGDVGSGKTAVAAAATFACAESGHQAVFLAPTEILAQQQFSVLSEIFSDFNFNIGFASSSSTEIFSLGMKAKISKKEFFKKTKEGELQILIGTHALLQKNIEFKNPGLVVIDEQHRFGVRQRSSILETSQKIWPHLLVMTATPIPRTLALTLWGNLEISRLKDRPQKKKTITKIVPPENRKKAYAFIKALIKKGRQAFVICPLIDGSEKTEAKSAILEYEKLKKDVFPDLNLAVLHGRMKGEEKEKIMSQFRSGKTDVLIATPVVEVGIDIPNAAIIIIENAERFGLAQIHQLRGRVGRGEHQSFCILFTDNDSQETKKRLNAVASAKSSFELAEIDLQLRGPGDFLGARQSGLPDYLMEALKNPELALSAKKEAEEILKNDSKLKKYPDLNQAIEKIQTELKILN